MKPHTFYFEIYGKYFRYTVDAYNSEDAYAIAFRKMQKDTVSKIKQVQPKQTPPKQQAPSDEEFLDNFKNMFGKK